MIRFTASAVFLLRDGFTGQTLTDGGATRCLLDGRPLRRPLWKREGYLVLTDLAPGEHVLQLSRRGYRDELVPIRAAEGVTTEDTVSLKPGPGYLFPRETVRVKLRFIREQGAAGVRVWLGLPLRTRLRLAQERAEAGDGHIRLFCEGNPALLPVPGHFLLADGKTPELVYLRSLRGETAELLPPLEKAHGRGAELIPMQPYDADEAGEVQVLLREPGMLTLYREGSVLVRQLQPGEQTLEWKLEG